VVAGDGTIRALNPKAEELFGWRADQLMGQRVETLLPDSLRKRHVSQRDHFNKNPHDRPMGAGLDLRAQRKDGSTFPVEVSLSPWDNEGQDPNVICSIRDVSAYRRLRDFSEGALRASEEERQRIARELHDDTAQRLATLILRVRMLAEESNDARRASLLEQVRAEIIEAADGVKRLSRGLRPPELEELGLGLAVRAYARTLLESGVFRVDTDLGPVDDHLDATAKLAVYRIIQEAISNARRHSGADRAMVRLAFNDDHVVAEIRDDGSGFALGTAMEGSRGLGLVGMQERATMIGGRIIVDSARGEGTRVRVEVPVNGRENIDG
jgi:PAS domain S-box-containing protein